MAAPRIRPKTANKTANVPLYVAAALMLCAVLIGKSWTLLALLLPGIVNSQGVNRPLLGAKRWAFLASGLITLASGAVILAISSGIIPTESIFKFTPWALLLALGFIYVAMGAWQILRAIWGTRVHESGIDIPMFESIFPWSRIVVKEWEATEGGYALHLILILVPPRGSRIEVIIPVPASERATLEEFLTKQIATAARPGVG
jgi:hypothetical protein